MKASKIASFIICLFISAFMFAQHNLLQDIPVKKDSCDINFKSSITTSDLELFAKCFTQETITFTTQSKLQTDKIDFSNPANLYYLSLEKPLNTQEVYNKPFFVLGDYNRFGVAFKNNNLAFFEANRNSILSAGYTDYTGVPNF
ncbi:hypothetical protein [Nonlabens sp. Asnod2-A12]|uniref:hypothetical protein n=1 Tax=Nonlabens sp. Asnod2-A12 TaxID=3160578 RepID=UPI00386D6F18